MAGSNTEVVVSETAPKTLIVERRYTKKSTISKNCTTNYAVSQNSTNCRACGCGDNIENGILSEKYTGSIDISNISIKELAKKIEDLQAENLVLTQRIQEFEDNLNN